MSVYEGKYKGKEIDATLDHVCELDEVYAVGLASLNERLLATQSATATGLVSLDERVFLFQPNAAVVSSVANLPSGKNILVAKIASSASLSFAAMPTTGAVIRLMVVNAGSADVVITIPNSGMYQNLGADTRTVTPGAVVQLVIMCDGEKVYIQ